MNLRHLALLLAVILAPISAQAAPLCPRDAAPDPEPVIGAEDRAEFAGFAASLNLYESRFLHSAAERDLGKLCGLVVKVAPQHVGALQGCRTRLAAAIGGQGRFAEAEPILRQAIAAQEARYGQGFPGARSASRELAMQLRMQGRFAEADEVLAGLARSVRTCFGAGSLEETDVQLAQASLRGDQANFTEAEALLSAALATQQAVAPGDRRALADIRSRRARIWMELGRYKAAGEEFRSLLAEQPQAAEPTWTASVLNAELGWSLYRQGLYAEAEALLRKAVADSRTLNPESFDTGAHSRRLTLFLWRTRQARDFEGGFRFNDSKFLNAFAPVDRAAELLAYAETTVPTRPVEIEAAWREALAMRATLLGSEHPDTADAQLRFSAWLLQRDRVTEAEPLALAAVASLEKRLGPDHPRLADGLEILSTALWSAGRATEAEATLRRVMAIRARTMGPAHPERAYAAGQLAGWLDATGRRTEAEPLWAEAMANMPRVPGQRTVRLLLDATSHALSGGECRDVLKVVGQLRQLSLALFDSSIDADIHILEARTLLCLKRREEAEAAFTRATGPLSGAWTAQSSVESLVTWAEAIRTRIAASQAAEAARVRRTAFSLTPMPPGDQRTAVRAFSLNLALLWDAFADAPNVWAADPFGYGRRIPYAGEGRETPAEKAEGIRLFKANQLHWGFMTAQDLEMSSTGRALAYAAARSLADPELEPQLRRAQDLEARVRNLNLAVTAGATGQGDASQAQRARAELETAARELQELQTEIRAKFPKYAELVTPRALGIAEVQKQLAPDEAILLLTPAGPDIHVFAVSKTQATWVRREGAAGPVAADVAALRCQVDPETCGEATAGAKRSAASAYGSEVAGRLPPFDGAKAHRLYRELAQPVEGVLSGVKTLYVTASGPLSGLPLGVLVTEPPAGGPDADAQALAGANWLADRYALVTLPSVSSLWALGAIRTTSGRLALAGFGNPSLASTAAVAAAPAADPAAGRGLRAFRGAVGAGGMALADPATLKTMASLPETETELRTMASALGAPASAVRLGPAATETAVKTSPDLAQARVVIFATHGLLPRELKGLEEPGLVFTPPATATAEDDGVLTASEAARLNLSADWVILSACNTAAADGTPGAESLSGLAKAFLYAGAQALLASHWRVADDSTSVLTVQTLAIQKTNPGFSKAQALQAAMKAVRTGKLPDGSPLPGWKPQWAHPAAWAPFTLVSAGG